MSSSEAGNICLPASKLMDNFHQFVVIYCSLFLGGRLVPVGIGVMSLDKITLKVSKSPESGNIHDNIPMRSLRFCSPNSVSSSVSTFSKATCSSVRYSNGGNFALIASTASSSTVTSPDPNGLLRAAFLEKSLSKYHHINHRKPSARLLLLKALRTTRSKKSRGGVKCSSETLGAYCASMKMRLTGFVRGTRAVLRSSRVLGCSDSSVAPLSMDLSRGASCSCLYELGSCRACNEGMEWYVRN